MVKGAIIQAGPESWKERVRIIGPGLVWAAAAIGSGELIITTKVGAEYGYTFLWAIWVGIWFKFWIHKGLLDLTLLTGKPVIELWHKLKGGRLYSSYWLLFFTVTATGLSGLIGLTSSIAHAIFPFMSLRLWAFLIVLSVVLLAYFQNYQGFERTMLSFCLILTIGAFGTAILAKATFSDMMEWGIPSSVPAMAVFLSLLGWGAGSGPDLMIPYSWWVREKGYHNLKLVNGKALIDPKNEPAIQKKVAEWLSLAKWDTLVGYITAGTVASLFLIGGAAILKPRGVVVEGVNVLTKVSAIFTETYGTGTFYLFMIPAFFAVFSTTLGVFDGGRITIAHLARMLARKKMIPIGETRANRWYRVTLILYSLIPLLVFYGIERPVLLVIIAGIMSAVSMPCLGFLVFRSLRKFTAEAFEPNKFYQFNLMAEIIVYLYFTIESLRDLLS